MVGTSDRPTDEPTTDHTADDTETATILSDTDDDPASKYDIDTDKRAIIVDSDGTPQMTMPRRDHNQFVGGEGR